MVHLRIVAPEGTADAALKLLERSRSVCNVILLEGAARKPAGDLILCDVARADASVIVDDLKELEIPEHGSIAVELSVLISVTTIPAAANMAWRGPGCPWAAAAAAS